jgi:EAL domain-containing protein (putative c-di-GMP-specific phosphodiesterase class I)
VKTGSLFLEGYFENPSSLQRVRLEPLPFEVGRTSQAGLMLDSSGISRDHARFFEKDGVIFVEDAGSTNGTYLNRTQLHDPAQIRDGDIVHFAEVECRVVDIEAARQGDSVGRTRAVTPVLSSTLPQGTREFQQLLEQKMVTAHFQPIVHTDGNLFAYEILGRGTHPDLPEAPLPLFRIAESLDLEVPFSESLRLTGLELARSHGVDVPCFLNIHPAEIIDAPRLMSTLEDFRKRMPDFPAVLEIHEGAVTNLTQMREIRLQLNSLDIGLAYDDFGAGQARLLEVAEIPPDYVKFDMALIRNIDTASDAQRSMLTVLVRFCRDTGIKTLAEGVARSEEADTCRELGFDLFQGFHFGRPAPLEDK